MVEIRSVVFWGLWYEGEQECRITKGHEKTFGGDRYINYIDGSNNFRDV